MEDTDLVENPVSPQSVLTPTVLVPEEEIDRELQELETCLKAEILASEAGDYRNLGVLAYQAGISQPDMQADPKTLFDLAIAQVEHVRKTKVDQLSARIGTNNARLGALRTELDSLNVAIAGHRKTIETAAQGCAEAWKDATKQRLLLIGMLAKRQVSETAADQERQESEPSRAPLYALDQNVQELPSSPREARLAYLWRRIIECKRDHDESRQLVTALERNGISHGFSRFLTWAGYTIMAGAGGAIGALLQESDIGNHLLERLFAAVQLRLGFVKEVDGILRAVSVSDQWEGLFTGVGIVVVLSLVLVITLLGFAVLRRKVDPEAGDEDEFDKKVDQAHDSGPFGKSVWSFLFRGDISLLRLVPGVVIGGVGLVLFLALGPSFASNENTVAFSVTRTSIGFVVALAVVCIVQILFAFSLFPAIRTRLLNGEGLQFMSNKAAVTVVLIFVFLTTLTIAMGPAWAKSTAPKDPWSTHIVWLATATCLLLSCATLSLGNFFRGIHGRGKYVDRLLRQWETKFAEKIPDPEADRAQKRNVDELAKPLDTEITHKWRADFDSDSVLRRIVLSGAFDSAELTSLFESHTELTKRIEKSKALETELKRLTDEELRCESEIKSVTKSTNNYENRIAKLEQQAAGVKLLLHERFFRTRRCLDEGYRIAAAAYQAPPDAAMAAKAGS